MSARTRRRRALVLMVDTTDHINKLKAMISQESRELSDLEQKILSNLNEQSVIAKNVNESYESKATLGEKLADGIASFGGSWYFLISFSVALGIWILYNSLTPTGDRFDPFPFILLNLFLSCLAAIQAPIIMMSQNRQESKDRIRAEHDYLVNLKAELEIRQLHMKMDQLLNHQWKRLLEIQELQAEIMQAQNRD